MDMGSVISVLSLMIGFLSFLFAIFLLTVKSDNRISNIFIASYLLLTAFDISVYYYADYITLPPVLEMLRIRSSAFKSPLLFLYILSVVHNDFKLKRIHLINILPFLVGIAVLLPRFFLAGQEQQAFFFSNYLDMPEIKFLVFFGYSVTILYIVISFIIINRYKTLLLENYATNDTLSNYYFLNQLIILVTIGFTLTLTKEIFQYHADRTLINIARIVMLIYGLFFYCWLVLKALHSPKLFRGVDTNMQLVKELVVEEETPSSLKATIAPEVEQQISSLKLFMEEQEPYLNPDLTINQLAKFFNIPSRDLSILINHHLNQHFFDFINEYRIKKAMQLLKDPTSKKLTVLEILYQVGFNSKSSFNTAFKKVTALTPTQYRKSNT